MTNNTRHQFLFKVYDQMFADINQHINVVWQSIGVVIGSLALLSLAEKNIIPIKEYNSYRCIFLINYSFDRLDGSQLD